MDDDNFDFGDDFGGDDFFDDDLADVDPSDGPHGGDLGGRGVDLGYPGGGITSSGSEDSIPPRIKDVQVYLPNVSPTALPVMVAVLAQADLEVGVDLRLLSCATRNVEFMPNNRIVAATMRLHEPSAVVLVRSSGSLTIIGAASMSEARQAAELAARIIRTALNLNFTAFRFRVRSIMARFNACSPVRLDDLAHHRFTEAESPGLGGVFCSYEPERFNGCTVRLVGKSDINKWNVSCTVFVTGKINMMGARSAEELQFAFDALVPIIAKYIGSKSGRAA